jgi:glycosyltransferase involved in cell wall biosynthesis
MPRVIKIGFASTDWSKSLVTPDGPVPGGSNWVRIQQSRKHLKYQSVTGLLVNHKQKGFGIIDWFGKTHYDCSIIVLQRLMFGALAEQLAERKPSGPVILNDIDDWYWGLHEENHAYKLTHPDYNKEENIDHYRSIVELGDGVVASTPFLEEKMRIDFGCKNVFRVENCVTVSDFATRYYRNKKTVVGWVGSTSHRSGDLDILKGVLDNRKFRVHHSGHIDSAAWFADKVGLPRDKVTKMVMHHPQQYAKLSFQFDIGVAPLNDIPFNWAKSWIKGIEYAAAGVAFVASDVGEYRRLHDLYGVGRLATTPAEWTAALEELCDPGIRLAEAKRQREIVQENLNVQNMAAAWENVFKKYL